MDGEKLDELIKRVELFNGLTRDEVEKIFSRGMTMRAMKGDVVFYKDTVGSQMYIVLGGLIGVFEGETCIAHLRTGDMFGEMALVTNEPRSATVKAVEDTHLFVLTEDTFKRLMTKTVAIRILFNIIKTLSHRLKDTNKRAAH